MKESACRNDSNLSLHETLGARSCSAMKSIILLMLHGYKRYISPWLPRSCRFEPTCSEYMYQAVERRGVPKGILLGVKRLLRCHPFCQGGFDPVP
jgi:putative membrane protein insertion efficiency factor